MSVGTTPRLDTANDASSVPHGHYARKQLDCRSSVIAFSHRARFETAIALAGSNPRGRILDYGSGDGTFLSMVAGRFGECLGADIARDQVEDCRARFAVVPNVHFCELAALRERGHEQMYDVVTCMEVLEHCPPSALRAILGDIARLVAPGGRVIISVPIETGPTFVVKYAVRTVAGWRGLSDYRYYERYPIGDALRMIFATRRTQVHRPISNEGGFETHSHYGFNWHHVEEQVAAVLTIERRLFSPFNLFGGAFSSQAWLVCRPQSAASAR